MVDSQLLATIATAAEEVHPVRILSFGSAGPGATPGVPLRSAVIYGTANGSAASTALLTELRHFWLVQRGSYLPANIQIVPGASGQSALRIQYAAPSPPGLLGSGPPVVKIPSR